MSLSPPAPLLAVVRMALGAPRGRVALRVPALPPHRRRVARALLQEGALAAGGTLIDTPDGDLLLVGAESGRAERLRRLLDRLLPGTATEVWSLERDAAALLDYAGRLRQAGPAVAPPELADLDAWIAALPLARVIVRQVGIRLEASGEARPGFLRLDVARGTLAALMGPLGGDADLLRHAAQGLAGRLLKALGEPAQRQALVGATLPGPLHLPLPPAAVSTQGGGRGGPAVLVAVIGLAEAAEPAALAARRAGLAAQGWDLEIDGLDAAALSLVAAEALPADLLRLHWSPALASTAAMAAAGRIDPARLTLAGVVDQVALDWARRLGLRRLEGPYAEQAVLRPGPRRAPDLPEVVPLPRPAGLPWLRPRA